MEEAIINTKIEDLIRRIDRHFKQIQVLEASGEHPHSQLMNIMAEKAWDLTRELEFWFSQLPGTRYKIREDLQNIQMS